VSLENIEVVRGLYGAWGRGEFPGPPELLDADVEYVNPVGAIEPGVKRGRAGFARAVANLFEGWSSWQMEPESLEASGDQVAVVVRFRARARQSGIELQGRESALVTLRDGRVVRYEWFHGPADAGEALRRAK
jgi:ketosteroid isomerase-like protein